MGIIFLVFLLWIFFEFFLNWVLFLGLFGGVQGAVGLFAVSFVVSYGLLGYLILQILNFRGGMLAPLGGRSAQLLTFVLVLAALFLPSIGLLHLWVLGEVSEKYTCPPLGLNWIASACQGVVNKLPSIAINVAVLFFMKMLVKKIFAK
jgi:hypothetical protein